MSGGGFAARKERALAWLRTKPWFVLTERAAKEFSDDDGPRISAAMAYYGIFSLAPLILVATGVAGLAFGDEAARGEISNALERYVSADAAAMVESMVAASDRTGAGVVATVIGILVALWGASTVFAMLESALNKVWEVEEKPSGGWKAAVLDRLRAAAMAVVVGVVLLAVLAAGVVIPVLADVVGDALPGGAVLWQILHLVVTFALAAGLFTVLYRLLPDAEVAWGDAWRGGAVTAAVFALAVLALALYLGLAAPGSTYGAAGSVIVVLLWLYVASMAFFFGAEFTQVYANARGAGIRPERGARPERGEEPSDEDRPSRPSGSGRGA